MENFKTAAIVLASGSGQRFEAGNVPKHLTPVLEVPVLIWTLNTIYRCELFSSVAIVCREKDFLTTKKSVENFEFNDSLNIRYAIGASERTESFISGFNELRDSLLIDNKSMVALFDANRPLTTVDQLVSLNEAALRYGCSCPARPVINGVAKTQTDRIIEVPDKKEFVEFVTPEFIKLEFYTNNNSKNCFMKGYDCFVEYSLNMGFTPKTISASSLNSKLTYPEDKTFLEGLAIDNKISIPKRSK